MPHIQLRDDLPGIRGLVAYRPDTGRPLYELAGTPLRSESTLSQADREPIAAAFSMVNRHVDDLAAWAPDDPQACGEMGERMAEQGYAVRFRQIALAE